MGYAMRWGPKGFLVSSDKIVPIEQFTTSYKLKKDTNDAANNASASNTRGRDLQPIAVSTHYYRALGTEPREQIEEWASLIGEYHPLYLGEKRFGPAYVQLQSVSVTDTQMDNNGVMLFCAISLAFEEFVVEPPKVETPTTTEDGQHPSYSAYLKDNTANYIQPEVSDCGPQMQAKYMPELEYEEFVFQRPDQIVTTLTASAIDKANKNPHGR